MQPTERSSGWRRALVITAVVLLVVVAADTFTRARASALPPPLKWATADLDQKAAQIAALERRGGASVVFIGSSTVDAGVAPSAIHVPGDDRPAYNAAVRGGTVRMYAEFAERVAIPRLHPSVVVLGVASRELNANDPKQRDREHRFFDAPAVRHLEDNETALQRAERHLETTSALFKYRTWMRQPRYLKALFGLGTAPSVTSSDFGDYLAPDGQFLFFLQNTFNPYALRAEQPKVQPSSRAQRTVLHDLLRFMQAHVRRVVVVNMPVTNDYIAAQPAGQRSRFNAILADEAKHIDAEYLKLGIWPDVQFADSTHVNAAGSKRLTQLLESTIRAAG